MGPIKYSFVNVEKCLMCHKTNFKVLGKRLNKSQGYWPKRRSGVSTSIVKCTNCGLIFPNPQPVPESINDHYGVPPENYWKQAYFNYSTTYLDNFILNLKNIYPFTKGQTLLDIGIGLGKALNAYQSHEYQAFGIEPSTPFFNRAIEKFHFPLNQVFNCSIEEATFEPEFFDIILFSAVLEHLYNPDFAIKKALSWLKPGGLIFISVPSAKWLTSKMINLLYQITGSDYVTNLSPMHEPYHLYEFTLESFKRNALLNNYSIVNYQFNICDTFLPKPFDPIVKTIMKISNTGMEITVWLKKNK